MHVNLDTYLKSSMARTTRKCRYKVDMYTYKCQDANATSRLEIRVKKRNILQLSLLSNNSNNNNNENVVFNVDDVVSPVFSYVVSVPSWILGSPDWSRKAFVLKVLKRFCGLHEESICEKLAENIGSFLGKQTLKLGLKGFAVIVYAYITAFDVNHNVFDPLHLLRSTTTTTNNTTTTTTT
ncbi:hypothetical protein CsatA_022524 [Cannabis sativa]